MLNIYLHCQSLSAGKGGVERVSSELAGEMVRRNHTVYLAYRDNGPPAYSVDSNVILMPYKSYEQLKRDVLKIDPNVFFVFYVNHLVVHNYAIAHQARIPFGMQECTNPERLIHNNWKLNGNNNDSAISWVQREAIASGASRIRFTMPGYEQSLPDYIRPQIRAFSNPSFPQIELSSPGHCEGQLVIANIGGLKPNKNLVPLLMAFSQLSDEFPHWVIKVYGKSVDLNDSYHKSIMNLIMKNRLDHRVQFCGSVENIYEVLVSAHIHVISSLSEGCPTCVLEAMATGLPSIGFAECPGTNQLIRDGVNGLLVSAKDEAGGLQKALRDLMGSGSLRHQLGRQALKDSGSLSPHNVYNKWESLLKEASSYKGDLERLLHEQMEISEVRALESKKIREKLIGDVCSSKKLCKPVKKIILDGNKKIVIQKNFIVNCFPHQPNVIMKRLVNWFRRQANAMKKRFVLRDPDINRLKKNLKLASSLSPSGILLLSFKLLKFLIEYIKYGLKKF